MDTLDATLALDARADLLEGPIWDAQRQCLYFVDIMAGRVHCFDPAAKTHRTHDLGNIVGSVGAVALGQRDELILAARDGFVRFDASTGVHSAIAAVEADRPRNRMNDGTCDPAGRFWAGTMSLDETPGAGALYRLDPTGDVHVMVLGATISNGIDWSVDVRTMYYVDSPTHRIDAFDFDLADGRISNRRPFVRIPHEHGIPDGLTLDAEGYVWVALWRGSTVHRYAPNGTLAAVVRVPTPCPTACAFGGPDFRDLFITTAAIELTDRERAEQPLAGGLFVCRPGAAGRAPNRFAG